MSNQRTALICVCGKDAYASQTAAKNAGKELQRVDRARKTSGYREMRTFECTEQLGTWHLTQQRRSRAAESSAVRASTDAGRHVTRSERVFGPALVKPDRRKLVSINSAPSKRAPARPQHTECSVCERRWLSDIDPAGRRCPGCGSVGTIVIGWAERGRDFIRSVAA